MKTMEKDFSDMIIYNSILNSLSKEGINYTTPLKIVPISNFDIKRIIPIEEDKSDFIYFNKVGEVSVNEIEKVSNFSIYSSNEEQLKWLKDYIETPNRFVKLTLKEFIAKTELNNKLKNLVGEDLLNIFRSVCDSTLTREYEIKEKNSNNLFSKERFQDLVYISLCETVHNPLLELDDKNGYKELNNLFWIRFNELFSIFENMYGKNDIIRDSFFDNENIKKRIEKYGYENMEDAIIDKKYPRYLHKFQPTFQIVNLTKFDNLRKEDKEYINFRKREYDLYIELCNKYNIEPKRDVIY